MSLDSTRHFEDPAAAQQRFLSLFLRSEREIFRYVAALVPNVADAEDIVQQTALSLWEKFDAYDPTQPFTPWACRFALNKTRQWLERRQRWQALLEGGLADAYAGIFRAFVRHRDSVKMVTFWGVNDAVSWRAQGKPSPRWRTSRRFGGGRGNGCLPTN